MYYLIETKETFFLHLILLKQNCSIERKEARQEKYQHTVFG